MRKLTIHEKIMARNALQYYVHGQPLFAMTKDMKTAQHFLGCVYHGLARVCKEPWLWEKECQNNNQRIQYKFDKHKRMN